MKGFHDVYREILQNVLKSEVIEVNKRTDVEIKIIECPISFSLDLSDKVLPIIGTRKTFPKSAAAEIAWFLTGEQKIDFISKYAPFWNKFTEMIKDDNCFEFEGVAAAYGYRWRKHFGRDQIQDAIDALKKDASNRRVYISAWDAKEDGLLEEDQKNVPCPIGFTLSIVNGKLNSSMLLRSSDIFVGLPYDVMGHCLLIDAIAESLSIKPGYVNFTLAHPHLYKMHWEMAAESLKQQDIVPKMLMPGKNIEEIEANLSLYVDSIIEYSKAFEWSPYNPKPHVVDKKQNKM